MKRILLVGFFLVLKSFSYAASLDLDLSKERNYLRVEKGGVIYMVHPSLSDDAEEMEESLSYLVKIFSEVERTIPNTARAFKQSKSKIFLYEFDSSTGGMEYVRENQSSWDNRFNPLINNSVIIPKAFSYSKTGHFGFAYLLHEIAHFHHLNIIKDTFDKEIKAAYRSALGNPNYSGAYASSNYLEYFAEISTAYLLESHRTSTFPKGSKELYVHDRIGYDLCKKIWGADLAAYKPEKENTPLTFIRNTPPVNTDNNRYPVKTVIKNDKKHNPYCGCTTCSAGHAARVFKPVSKEEADVSKKFLEIITLINRAEMEEFSGNNAIAGWAYGNIFIMLEKFQSEHPNESPATVINLINKVKSKRN